MKKVIIGSFMLAACVSMANAQSADSVRISSSTSVKARFYLAGGLALDRVVFYDFQTWPGLNPAAQSLTTSVFLGLELFKAGTKKEFLARLECGYWVGNYVGMATEGGTNHAEYAFQIPTFSPALMGIYSFHHTGQLRLYAGAGAGFNYCNSPFQYVMVYRPNESEELFVFANQFWLQAKLCLGAEIRSKSFIELFADVPANETVINLGSGRLSQYGLKFGWYLNGN